MTTFWGLVILFLLVLIVYFVHKLKQRAKCFENHGVPYLGGILRNLKFMMGIRSLVELQAEIYQAAVQTESPMVGITAFTFDAALLVTDADLVKAILVKDFDHFGNNMGIPITKANKYFGKMLFLTNNDEWKRLRTKLNPVFTSGKLKKMFHIFRKSSERMDVYLREQMNFSNKNSKSMDMDFAKIFPKYAMDVTASCAFGVDSKSFEVKPDKRSMFEQMGSQYGFRAQGTTLLRQLINVTAPKVADFFAISALDPESEGYFVNVIKEVIKQRRETSTQRDDFLQVLLGTQEGMGKSDGGRTDGNGDSRRNEVFDDDDIIGTSLSFLMGGIDPTESALLFALYALAMEPEVQEKVYQEVKTIIANGNGHLSYDAIGEMKYLDLVLKESMRLYPHVVMFIHVCRKNYTVLETNQLIEKGTVIMIPVHDFHMDSRYFANPERFIPERFSVENMAALHPYAYMPFGHGPRICVGMRFAMLQVKAVIAQLVTSFRFAPCSKTKIPLEFDRNPSAKPKGGEMWLNVSVRDTTKTL